METQLQAQKRRRLKRFRILEKFKEKLSSYQYENLKSNPRSFINMKKNQILCNIVIKFDGLMIKYVPEKYQSWRLRMNAVIFDGLSLKHIIKHTPLICKEAILNNPLAIQYINFKQMEETYLALCLIAYEETIDKKKDIGKLKKFINPEFYSLLKN